MRQIAEIKKKLWRINPHDKRSLIGAMEEVANFLDNEYDDVLELLDEIMMQVDDLEERVDELEELVEQLKLQTN